MSFRIHALPSEPFAELSSLGETELAGRLVKRMGVDSCPGYPCRVSHAIVTTEGRSRCGGLRGGARRDGYLHAHV